MGPVRLKLEAGDSETRGRSNQLVAPGLMTAISSDPAPEFEADDVRRVSTAVGPEDYYDHDWFLATLTVDHQLGGPYADRHCGLLGNRDGLAPGRRRRPPLRAEHGPARHLRLVSCPVNSLYFSVPHGACGKARPAGNGPPHCQGSQRRHKPRAARPSGARSARRSLQPGCARGLPPYASVLRPLPICSILAAGRALH